MNHSIFKGSATAIVTPFDEAGVNYDAFAGLIEFQLSNGADALVVCGTTGEPSTMTEEERINVIDFCIRRVNKRVPVIAGTGGNNTAAAVSFSVKAEALGADALLVVTPYYNKCTQNGLIKHYTLIADSVSLPVIAYNVPGRTGLNMLPSTVRALRDAGKIKAIKEASANIAQISDMCALANDDFAVYSGDDGLVLPVLALGGSGVISVVANLIPGDMHQMCSAFFSGNIAEARRLQLDMLPLIKAIFVETNPIPIKAALNLINMNAGILRMPLTQIEDENLDKLKIEMKNYGIRF